MKHKSFKMLQLLYQFLMPSFYNNFVNC